MPDLLELPALPVLSDLPALPDLADLPDLPGLPDLPDLPDWPVLHGLSALPDLPVLPDLPDRAALANVADQPAEMPSYVPCPPTRPLACPPTCFCDAPSSLRTVGRAAGARSMSSGWLPEWGRENLNWMLLGVGGGSPTFIERPFLSLLVSSDASAAFGFGASVRHCCFF